MIIFFIALIIILIIIIITFCLSDSDRISRRYEEPQRIYGREGEQRAAFIIGSVLRPDDRLLRNVKIEYEGKRTELDNVIVNKYGVFIIEVKNYKGKITGREEDYEWIKYHVTEAGNMYRKTVSNPIKQIKRQIYILAGVLKYYCSVNVWIEGYAMLLHKNSPVESEFILSDTSEIDKVIHTAKRKMLTPEEISIIVNILSDTVSVLQ